MPRGQIDASVPAPHPTCRRFAPLSSSNPALHVRDRVRRLAPLAKVADLVVFAVGD